VNIARKLHLKEFELPQTGKGMGN